MLGVLVFKVMEWRPNDTSGDVGVFVNFMWRLQLCDPIPW